MRVNKYLANAGICSRRQADELVASGRIRIDNVIASAGDQVLDGQMVYLDDEPVKAADEKVILLYNKPRGIVCTAEEREKNNIISHIGYPIRIYPVGRLDKDSRGLILLSNDGGLTERLMKSRYAHEREYEVTIDRPVSSGMIQKMSDGIFLEELGVTTKPAKVVKISKNVFRITLTQGLNRQIRRMCKECGARVTDLCRIRIENLMLGDLAEDSYRLIEKGEEAELRKRI